MATAKRLLKSQEETMKEREEERRQLKGRVITADLETRGKDSQIRHLNVYLSHVNLVATLKFFRSSSKICELIWIMRILNCDR